MEKWSAEFDEWIIKSQKFKTTKKKLLLINVPNLLEKEKDVPCKIVAEIIARIDCETLKGITSNHHIS